jgi:hypothetical protein
LVVGFHPNLHEKAGKFIFELNSIELDFRQLPKEDKWIIGYLEDGKEVFRREKYLDMNKREIIVFAFDLEFGAIMIPYDPARLLKKDK